jgi:signal transduction histidine kinase
VRKKLTIALMSTVAITVLAAGIGVLEISNRIEHDQTIAVLSHSSTYLSKLASTNEARFEAIYNRGHRFAGARVLLITASGVIEGIVRERVIDQAKIVQDLLQLQPVTTSLRNTIIVLTPFALPQPFHGASVGVVVETRTLPKSAISQLYLALVAVLTLALAYLLARFLSRRLTTSLYSLIDATNSIAQGDLDVVPHKARRIDPELGELTESIQRMAIDLKKAREAEQSFLLSISHDLRTPLTSIAGFSESIIDGAIDDPKRAAATILRESQRIEHLVVDLLELTKLRSSRFSLELKTCSLNQLLDDLANAYELRCKDLGLRFTYRGLTEQVSVLTDPYRFLQVLENLCNNACKYTSSWLEITVARSSEGVVISVVDDGPGIPLSDQSHLFKEQYRSSSIAANTDGSGLGLLIVGQLARSLKLRIAFRTPLSPRGGTEMTVIVPHELATARGITVRGPE